MLISKEVEVKISGTNIKHYQELGYEIPKHLNKNNKMVTTMYSKITVGVEDIPRGSHTKIQVKCDYCGDIFTKSYQKYILQQDNSIVKKDCCAKCKQQKTEEGLLIKYGVKRNTQIENVRKQMSKNRRTNSSVVLEDFKNAGLSIVEDVFYYKNDRTPIKFICDKHKDLGIQETKYFIIKKGGAGCRQCRYDKVSNENCHMWKGGTTPVHTYLRGKIRDWKAETMESNDYRCDITGNPFDVIHHIYSFNTIVHEVLKCTGLDLYDEINQYTETELNLLERKCSDLHKKYGLGVCLVSELHVLYHSKNMGIQDDMDTYCLFKNNYYHGEYDDELSDELKSYNNIVRETHKSKEEDVVEV